MKVPKLNDKTWLILRALVFPLVIIAPFFLTWQKGVHCIPNGIALESGAPILGAILLLFFATFLAVTLTIAGPSTYRHRKQFIKSQVIISILSVAITLPVYAIMSPYSQAVTMPFNGAYCDSNDHLHIPDPAPYDATFGMGIPAVTVFALTVLYLAVPLCRLFLSKNNIRQVFK
jgi:hypothetical protein